MASADEDVIKYWLVIINSDNNSIVTDCDELNVYSDVFSTYLNQFTENYIWNRDPFALNVVDNYNGDDIEGPLPPVLHGITAVGELIEDEWFITFLLLKLTEQFANVVVRVEDSDGEFLLFEAADHLPRWCEYKNAAQQRVLLYRGAVHLVPPSDPSEQPSTTVLPIMDAVTAVTSRPSDTLASPHIQEAIQLRINKYPGSVRREQHVAHAYVPVGVAALLREYPTLVAPAITAFADRDMLDNKALRIMKHFPPEQRVQTAVRFSKALYAKVMSTSYLPDRKTGWNLPLPTHQDYKTHSLGVKLACGFELLVCNAGGVTPSTPSEGEAASSLPSVTSNPRWGRYKQALTDKGYFRGELEGSKLYKELESNALKYFSQHMLQSDLTPRPGRMDPLSAGAMIIKLLKTVNSDMDFFKERQKRLVPADDDSWLNISPELLEEMLESKFSSKDGPQQPVATSSGDQLQSGLEAFLKNSSDFEGAEITEDLQEKLRKLSTMSLPRRKESTMDNRKKSVHDRKLSHARKISQNLSVHPQSRKISSQSNASTCSQMSSFSNKIDLNAEAFSDAYLNCMEKYFDDDDYFRGSDDESSGLSSYGDEDSNDSSEAERKISSGSTTSGASSSGIDPDLRSVMREMESQLRGTSVRDNIRNDDTSDEDDQDEFDDVESFEPVKVDASTVEQLVKTYREERGGPGPATTLFASLGMKPK